MASWIQWSSSVCISLFCLASCGISVTVEYSESDGGSGAVSGKGGTNTGGAGGHSGGSGGTGTGGNGGNVVACNNSLCEPAPPSGWQGFAYVVGASNADPTPVGPTCPDGSEPQTYFTQPAGAAECSPCACGALGGVNCSVPFLCSTSSNCAGATDYTLSDGDCQGAASTPPKSCMLGAPTFSGGSCAPSGGALTTGFQFQQVAHVCLANSPGTCTGGAGACVAPGTDAYAGYVCIYQVGEQSCPADYSIPIVTYKKPIDTRACSACSCAASVTGCTLGGYQFFHDAACLLGGPNVTNQSCTSFTVVPTVGWGWKRTNAPAGIGSCTPNGGVGSGEVKGDPGQAVTYCCKSP